MTEKTSFKIGLDFREAYAVLEEMGRRQREGLAMYEQLALLARLKHPYTGLRSMTRATAGKLVKELSRDHWYVSSWVRLYDEAGVVQPGSDRGPAR